MKQMQCILVCIPSIVIQYTESIVYYIVMIYLWSPCHFSGSCTFLANGTSLGAPDCKAHHNIYLKTVYTCIHQSVLKPQYIDTPSRVRSTSTTTTSTTSSTTTTTIRSITTTEEVEKLAKPAETMLDDDMNTLIQDDQILIGSDFDFTSQRASQDSQQPGNEASNGDSNFVVGFVGDFFASYHHIKEHKEKFILFVSLTLALGLSVVAALFLWNSYR